MSWEQAEIRELKVNRYIVIDDEPCRIISIQTSKPGKHGEAKARLEAVGIFDGQKRSIVHPVTHKVRVPIIDKRKAQVLSTHGNGAQLKDLATYGASTEMVDGVTHMAADVVRAGKIPIVIGGEHSLAPAVVRAFPKDIGVIGVDAHLDFRDSYLSDRWSHACSARRIADHVGVEHVVYIGVRSYSRGEREAHERPGLTNVSAFDVHERGIGAALDRALQAINRDTIYPTVD